MPRRPDREFSVVDSGVFAGYHVVTTLRAEKRWFHGRARQLVARALCALRGHEATDWTLRDAEGVCLRRCRLGCGWVQTEHLSRVSVGR